MTMRPRIRYAVSNGINIAYTRHGRGEKVAVVTPPWVSNVDLSWDLEELVRSFEHIGKHHQVITIDKRGVGLSDRTDAPPTLDDRLLDTLAVMDAEGVQSAAIIGFSEAAAIGIALAARHPERVDRLLLQGSALPGVSRAELDAFREESDIEYHLGDLKRVVKLWGTDESRTLELFAPSVADNDRVQSWNRRFEVNSVSPRALTAHLQSAMQADITWDIDNVKCPVFIGHSIGDRVVPIACSRYLADRFPNATVRFWDSPDHMAAMGPGWREISNDMIEFVTGSRPASVSTRSFAVVLFTDIVDSTTHAREQGDEAWARLIRAHDAIAERVITDHKGRRVKSTGDGLLAIFADPSEALFAAESLRIELELLGIQIRAGVHAGLVEEQADGDVLGIAVNAAARIESVAGPGQVCVSRTVTDLLAGSLITFESLGAKELKGFSEPIEVFAVPSVR